MGELTYIETWQVTGNPEGDILEIAYTDSVYLTDEAIDGLRRYMAAAHECTLVKLLGMREIVVEVVKLRRGRWIKMSDADGVYWTCSECGEDIPRISHYNPQFDLFPRLESIDKTNYCPNCGARMERRSDE